MTARSALPACALLLLLTACAERQRDYFPGYAEGDYVRLSSPLAGTLVKLYLERGGQAQRDMPAFELERQSEQDAYHEAQARVQRAQAQVADLSKGRRPDEIAALRAQLAQGEAALALSQAEFRRQQKLAAERFISAAQLDTAGSALARDQARVNELRHQLRSGQLGARSDEIEAARFDLQAAQAALAQSAWALEQKARKVPADADVTDILYREGEWVPAGAPVISLLPPQNIKARFFVDTQALGQLRLGQPVRLQCDGCGAPIEARISFVAREAEYTAPLIYSTENRATLVFMIEARPSPQDARRLHPGQPLQVRLAAAS